MLIRNRISRIQDSLHAHVVRSDRAGIDTIVVVVVVIRNPTCAHATMLTKKPGSTDSTCM